MVFVFSSFFVFFKVLDAILGNRVSAETEIEGLDIPEMGALAYPDFVLGPGTPMGGMAAATVKKADSGAPALSPVRVEQ
jgi:Amt family ammonium transporter